LPGYGLETGSVVALAEIPSWYQGIRDFDLPRATGLALREYVPGNRIYANGHRFVPRRFHRNVDDEAEETPRFEVNVPREAVMEMNVGRAPGSLATQSLLTISVCDVNLVHDSQISDDEETRFQLPVATFGREQGRHNGGKLYSWGPRQLSLRLGAHFRLVNVGASSLVTQSTPDLGYPVCLVCGQSISPLSGGVQFTHFEENHEKHCGRKPEPIGFYADIVADCLTLPACANRIEAYSVFETLRTAASQTLDMHVEDLQILVLGHVDRDDVDAGHEVLPVIGAVGSQTAVVNALPKPATVDEQQRKVDPPLARDRHGADPSLLASGESDVEGGGGPSRIRRYVLIGDQHEGAVMQGHPRNRGAAPFLHQAGTAADLRCDQAQVARLDGLGLGLGGHANRADPLWVFVFYNGGGHHHRHDDHDDDECSRNERDAARKHNVRATPR